MFFQTIHQMIATGTDLSINIKRVDNKLTVAVMPKRANLKDEAQQLMVPLILSGQPEELDAGFLQAIINPVQKAQGILTNLEVFEKQAQQVASQSKAAKATEEKESKEVREKREKMEKLLKKAEEATAANRHSEAMTWLKQAKVLATSDKQKEIDTQMAAPQMQQVQAPYPQQPYQPQQPANNTPMQTRPGEQMQMFEERPTGRMTQQPVQTQPLQAQPQWQQPVYIPEMQPQASNPQWQQQASYEPSRQYPGQPQMYINQLAGQSPQNGPQMNGQQWQQPIPQQPQIVPMQTASGKNAGREYHSQPQTIEPNSFDKDDESDREFLREDPYAEYPDLPPECRMKDEAQMELVCC